MKFGSVCSGIEAASVAWHPLGWRAAWLAEIEPFPSAVLAHHYPDVPNIGDMTKLLELIPSGQVEAPDVFCGGTPCQAFSVAGLRKSLDDARGNLSLTFCEIADAIDHVRAARGEPPAIIFWENVPGVLNTKDNAFGCFLAGLAGEELPLLPAGGRWTNAGCVLGPKRAVAWRVLDAQYFGVAQRRRRVFVVASARNGFDPAAVLFEFDGVRRDSAPSRETGQGTAARAAAGTGVGGMFACGGIGAYASATLLKSGQDLGPGCETIITMAHGQGCAEIGFDRGPTLTCNHEAPIAAYAKATAPCEFCGYVFNHDLLGRYGCPNCEGEGFDASEDGTGRGTPLVPVAFAENSRSEIRLEGGDGNRTGALTSGGGKPGQGVPMIAFSAKDYGGDAMTDLSPTLRAGGHSTSHANAGVMPAIAFNWNAQPAQLPGPDRDTSINDGLTCSRQGAVAFAIQAGALRTNPASGPGGVGVQADHAYTLEARAEVQAVAFSNRGIDTKGVAETLRAGSHGALPMAAVSMQVRRLTPVECERLQGFPDGYTNIPWNAAKEAARKGISYEAVLAMRGMTLRGPNLEDCPDGPRYKALGNSWAVPNVRWIGQRIHAAVLALEHANDNSPAGASEVAA